MTHSAPPATPDYYVAAHTSVYGWGGGLTLSAELRQALADQGHPTLLVGVGPEATEASAERRNLPVHVPGPLWRLRHWWTTRAMAEALRALPPPRLGFVTVSPTWVPAAKRVWPGVPVVFIFACLLSNCMPFTWRRRRAPSLWTRLDAAGLRRIEHTAFAAADRILAPTRQARAEIEAFHPGAAERTVVYSAGFRPAEVTADERQASRARLGVGDEDLVFLMASLCDLNKSVDWAIRELPRVDPRGHLVIVGDGPEHTALEPLAGRLGVSGRVHILGKQPAVEPWHTAADCVMSTSYYDTFPETLKEALCRGRPVLVPRHNPPRVFAGLSEVIEDFGGGIVYDRMRAGHLAAAMNRIISEPQTRARLADEARRVALLRHGWGGVVEQIRLTCAGREPRAAAPTTAAQPAAQQQEPIAR